MKKKSTVLILGVTGMLGHTLFKELSNDFNLQVFATARNAKARSLFPKKLAKNIISDVNVLDQTALRKAINKVKPNVIVNCVGLIKQIAAADDVLQAIPTNTLLPHRLSVIAKEINARLILMSTDCVFSGKKGNYIESDQPDCADLYGQSKLLGEIDNEKHVLTIRTSIIGPELRGGHSLLNWFLKQKGSANGFTKAIYSGIPTIELAHILHDLVLPNPKLCGLYHIASHPISKFDLLELIANTYGKKIKLIRTGTPKIDRSLNCSKFIKKTGYKIKPWDQLVQEMHTNEQKSQ